MSTVNSHQIEEVSRELGSAALDPSLWPTVMEAISQATGSAGAALLQSDVRTPDMPRTAALDESMRSYFASDWHTRDLRARGVPRLLAGEPVVFDQDFVTPEEMRAHPYYNELLRPFNFLWFAGIALWAESSLWLLCLQRSPREGPFEEEDKKVLAALAPRLTEVATLSTAVGRTVISGVADALEAVRRPALVLDRLGCVLGSNAAADAMFDDEIRVRNRRLFLGDAVARSKLATLLEQLRLLPDLVGPPGGTIIARRESDVSVVIKLLAVPPAARSPFLGARALLTLSPVAPPVVPESGLISQLFGLTRAEERLAALIVTGLSLAEVSNRLGISRETARNQLKAVFTKTETHRQGELVALLSGLSA